MIPAEAKRKNRNRKIICYLSAMTIYACIYVILILILGLVNSMIEFNPYISFVCYILFFWFSSFFTKRILRISAVKDWIESF